MKYLSNYFLLLAVLTVAAACQRSHDDPGTEYAPQMYISKAYEPYTQVEKHPFNPMGINMREPVRGTYARRKFQTEFAGDSTNATVRDLMYYKTHKDSIAWAEKYLKPPFLLTEAGLAEGEKLYLQFCAPCHGEAGDGKGKVAAMYKGVPNYQAAAYKNMNSGHIFHVITHGKGRMWPHGSHMNPDERWKIVYYVHKLQGQDLNPYMGKKADTKGEMKKDSAEVKKDKALAKP